MKNPKVEITIGNETINTDMDTIKKVNKKLQKDEAGGIGHNSGGVSGDRIKSFVERVERLEQEKKALGDDIKDVYSEANGSGFDAKTIRKIVSLRKSSLDKRRIAQELLELYCSAAQLELF